MVTVPLSITHPLLATQWHPSKNGARTPDDVTAGASVKIWWVCLHGHVWEDTSNHRTGRSSGCAICSGKQIQWGFNDLGTTHRSVAAQWHPTRNGTLTPDDVTAGSGRKVWWQDRFGHEWIVSVNNRAQGTGCPFCSNNRVWAGFNDLATKFPAVAAQWHSTRNGELTPTEIHGQSGRKVWFQCGDGHEWEMTIGNRTALGQGCPICAGQTVLAGLNDMATIRPDLAAQWHPERNGVLQPHEVFPSTAKKFWWQCSLGHEWQASGNSRSNGANCPVCAGQRILVGFNDLATLRPELAAEWHPTRNGAMTPETVTLMNGKRVWWLCRAGAHEWSAVVSTRSLGNGCAACAGQTVIAGINDLAFRQPSVAKTWHPTRNAPFTLETIAVFSNRKMWWRCPEGHEWDTTVNNRSHGQGCPVCVDGGGFNRGRPGYLYVLEHAALGAFKVGITNVGTSRLTDFQRHGWQVLNLELFADGFQAAKVETIVKRWWRNELGLAPWLSHADMRRTGGWSETISNDELTAEQCISRIREERLLLDQPAR